jgi:endonuclease III-like uncharacterized protein
MRDSKSTEELKRIFQQILDKYPNTKLTFHKWLVEYGKVYTRK